MTARALLLLAALAGAPFAHAQDAHEARLRQVLDAVRQHIEAAPQQAVTADLDVTSIDARDGTSRTEHMHQASGAGRTLITGDRFSTFQDADTRVVIIDADKVIYLYDQVPGNSKPENDNWLQARDELLKKGDITTFQEKAANGDTILTAEITLREPERGSRLQRVRFEVDVHNARLRSVLLTYAEGATLRTQRYDYRSFRTGTLDQGLSASALAQVYHAGKPLPRYQGHRIVDLRQRSLRHAHH